MALAAAVGTAAACSLTRRTFWHVRLRIETIDLVFAIFVGVIVLSWTQTGYTGGTRAAAAVAASMLIPWATVKTFGEPDIVRFLQCIAGFGALVSLAYLVAIPFLDRWDEWERVSIFDAYAYGVIGPTVA